MHSPDDRLHLVRHGEVANPDWLVYGALPGFPLSDRGQRQATAAAERLATRPIRHVIASPLDRAVETAQIIAAPHGVAITTDPRLAEWRLSDRWAGHRWPDLPDDFPGELEAYTANPADLPFSPETLAEAGARAAAAAADAWGVAVGGGDVVVVGHQDPTEAMRRILTGRDFDGFNSSKPAHATIVTLAQRRDGWSEIVVYTPPQD